FRRPAKGRPAEKRKKRKKGTRNMAFLVVKHSLCWGRPSRGGTKSTDRKPGGVVQKNRPARKEYVIRSQHHRTRLCTSQYLLRLCGFPAKICANIGTLPPPAK